jgi:hypothetical protein
LQSHHDFFRLIVVMAFVAFSLVKTSMNNRKRGSISRKSDAASSAQKGTGLDFALSLFNLLKKPDSGAAERQAASMARQNDIITAIRQDTLPRSMRARIEGSRDGTSPWIATLSPAELLIARSHGIRPIAAVSATCWLHYGFSWTEGHAQGWETALRRLKEEAKAAGANAVLDVKMRTIPLAVESSMDFTLVGTAVRIDGLPPSEDPVIATVPALEFVKLLEADIVPTGIAIGAEYQWMSDWRGGTNLGWMGNIECRQLSGLWEQVRRRAHNSLRESAKRQGNGVLAHINFSQMFEQERGEVKQYLARHIVIATTVDTPHSVSSSANARALPLNFQMVVDMHAGKSPLTGTTIHHQSYASNDEEGAL